MNNHRRGRKRSKGDYLIRLLLFTLRPARELTITVSVLWRLVELPLLQEQAAQGFQVVQDSATSGHVLTQFRQVGGDKLEGLLAAF